MNCIHPMSTLLPDLCSVTDKKAGTSHKTVRKKCCHGKQKYRCQLCKGTSVCEHGRYKQSCKKCRGSSYCQHNKLSQYCKLCGGVSICTHGKQRCRCRLCGGISFCLHGKLKYRCRACLGSGFCAHGKLRERCQPCGGKQVCPHGKGKDWCHFCGGSRICSNCRFVVVKEKGGLCASCQPTPSVRSRCSEVKLAGTLTQWADNGKISNYTAWNKQNSLADPSQCGKYRVDFTFEMPSGVVLLECDEKQHSEYVKRCELVRQAEVALGFGGLPVHWIRYNPDSFKINCATRVTKREERESTLLRNLQLALTRPDYEHFIIVTYICYDNPGTTNADPDALVQRHAFKTVEDYNAWVEKSS